MNCIFIRIAGKVVVSPIIDPLEQSNPPPTPTPTIIFSQDSRHDHDEHQYEIVLDEISASSIETIATCIYNHEPPFFNTNEKYAIA